MDIEKERADAKKKLATTGYVPMVGWTLSEAYQQGWVDRAAFASQDTAPSGYISDDAMAALKHGAGVSMAVYGKPLYPAFANPIYSAPPAAVPAPDRVAQAKQAAMTSYALAAQVNDLAAITRRLLHALNHHNPGNQVASRAAEYLKRNNLQGEPLSAEDVLRDATVPAPCDWKGPDSKCQMCNGDGVNVCAEQTAAPAQAVDALGMPTLPGCLADRLYEAISIARDRAEHAGSSARIKKWEATAADLRAALAAHPAAPVPEAAQQNGGLVRAALIDLMEVEQSALNATAANSDFAKQTHYRTLFASARAALASQPAAPSSDMETVRCDACEGKGSVVTDDGYPGDGFMQPPDGPTVERCPDCNGVGKFMVYAAPVANAGQAQQSEFPERDTSRPAEQQGMFRKFDVRRADGSDAPGGKHHGCRYFVLDLDHDAHAPAAMMAYSMSCAATHPELSREILAQYPGAAGQAQAAAVPDAKFQLGAQVRKTKGSQWCGTVVGTYSTSLTPEGYAVESSTEHGSVQIYPAAALELVKPCITCDGSPPYCGTPVCRHHDDKGSADPFGGAT